MFPGFPPEALAFLRGLKRHNRREWFEARRQVYEQVLKQPMIRLVEALDQEFAGFAPEMVASPRMSMYRINRDVRFSADKSPYKTHIAAVFPRRDFEKHQGAGLYFHLAPRELLIAGGAYMLPPADLFLVRQHIAAHPTSFHRLVTAPAFRRRFGELEGEQLTRVPRGFPTNHPAQKYLKYKQFLAARTFQPEVATTPRLLREIVTTFEALMPLIRFLNDPLVAETARGPGLAPRGKRAQMNVETLNAET